MKLLILGGTRFLGRHLVQSALKAGFEVTLFNRGQSNPDLFAEVEHLIGDRDGQMQALAGRTWDVVVDTCGYVPRIVKHGLSQLVGKTGHYIFISTVSVYNDMSQSNIVESSAVKVLEDETIEEVNAQSYGGLKALCEQAVIDAFGNNATIIRPGVIAGPHDPSDRFTYWADVISAGGDVVAPGNKQQLVQVIDVRDLTDWLVAMMVEPVAGVFNTAGPQDQLTMEQMLTCFVSTLNPEARLQWIPDEFLLANDVKQWSDLPFWFPENATDLHGLLQCNSERAIALGLRLRPLTDTIKDTFEWHSTRAAEHEWEAGLSKFRREKLLELWCS